MSGKLWGVAGSMALGLVLLVSAPHAGAQEPETQRPTVRATITLRDNDKIVINRGAQDGLRKGDKLYVVHQADGRLYRSGMLQLTHCYRTTSEAIVLSQVGAVGPEDNAIFDPAAQTPKPVTRSQTPPAKPETAPGTNPAPVTQPARTNAEPVKKTEAPVRKEAVQLPLIPQFSTGDAGVAFSFDYTNEGEKDFDTGLYRTSAHLILDGLDYRTQPVTLTGNYDLEPGKSRSFSLKLTDFMVTKDTEVWPLKPGRHTVVIKFGGKDYGPLTFDWRSSGPASP